MVFEAANNDILKTQGYHFWLPQTLLLYIIIKPLEYRTMPSIFHTAYRFYSHWSVIHNKLYMLKIIYFNGNSLGI